MTRDDNENRKNTSMGATALSHKDLPIMVPIMATMDPTTEFGLPVDSKRCGFQARRGGKIGNISFICSDLEVVARDGIEPPTPAFSGLRSTS